MADFGGFEIEDDEKKPSSPSAFGGFEIEDGDEGESGETGPVSPAEASSPKSPAPTGESQSLAEFMGVLANGSASAPATDVSAWESGDGGEPVLPVGEKNQWGGNLRTEGRKPLIRRDANGKVNGYSTTTSMFVKHNDGRIAVVPTVVDGVELSTEDAVKHYAETGEHWGMADNEEGAKEIARSVHDEHQKSYQKGWNEYIQSHWDDMGDEIRNDPETRGERARRRRDARIAKEMEAWCRDANVIKGYRERTKTTQVAPELFLTGDLLEDADGNAVKPGDAIAVYHNEGDGPFTGESGQSARLMEYTGVNADGKPVFKETEGVSSEGAMVAGKLHVRDDDFASMLGKGKGKIELSPGERVRLNLLAETGNYHRYDDTLSGAATAIADRIVPYGGRIGANQSREQLRHLSNIYENILDEYPGKTDDEKRSVAAMDAGLDPIRKGESRDEYYARIRREAEEELRKRVIAKKEAGGKLSETEQGVLDKILTGGIESGGYALEFAIPGGAIFKGAKALGWGAKAVRAATMLGSAVPVVAAESMSRYQENVTPEYGFDDNGEFRMVAAPDDEEEAAYKAIGGAIFDTAVEVGLEAATMGLLRGAGKATGWALGKATPSAVREFGAKRFSKFMASETGQALRSINRAYQDFTAMTQINSPLGELAEENVQAFEKVLGLDGKSSEYKGLAKEWQDFKDNQLSWQTQWDIFYGLIAQLAIGSAKSTAEGISQHISSTDARRDIRMALKRSGISDETISTLTPKQQKTLTDMWQRYSANPDALKDRVKNLGYSMRAAVDELTARDGLKMRQSLEQRGIAPERFTIQTGEDGKPAFQQMMRFTPDGKQAPMNAMTDAAHGVTIVDKADGTFYVMNDFRGLDAIPAYSFEEAQKKADEEVVRNQSMDADNAQKAQYLMGLVQRQYAGRNVVSIPSEAALRWQVAQAVHDGGSIYGITRADQLFNADGSLKQPGAGGFHTPDGHIVVILDNVPSPAEMERVLAHEATGHEGVESATGRGANTVEFIQNAQAEGFSKFVLAEQQRAIQKFVAAGMDEATARMQVAAAMSTDEYAREAMARYAQGRLHQPTWYEKRKHDLNQRRRKAGEDVPIDQSDLEVMLAEAEKQGAQGANDLETLPGDSGVRYEEGATDEARNGADEAQPQQADENAGRDGQQPSPQAAEGPVEVAAPRGEAPDAGVVEPSKSDNGGQNLNAEAKKPKGKRGDNLRGRSYEDYAASPDDGGTADEMGAALLRFVRDNGGLLKMPPKGVADPMADWINAFLDGNARKNNRGEFVALFGMKPKTGANDAIAENMPSGLKEFVEGMIGRDGPGAVADWFLETRRKYREWAQNGRNAAQGNATDAVERYDFDELAAAQDAMDEEFANALGVLEGADEADYAMLTPENLKIAKSGDTIRFDHDRKSFVFGSYDAENGVLVVYDEEAAGQEGAKFRRTYRITENSIEEVDDGQENESGADANRAGNEEGSQGGGGGFQLESVTAEQITAEQKKRAEKEAIKKRQKAPLKGSGQIHVQPEMDLGQTGQQDLFSPVAEKPVAEADGDSFDLLKAIGDPNYITDWNRRHGVKESTDAEIRAEQRRQVVEGAQSIYDKYRNRILKDSDAIDDSEFLRVVRNAEKVEDFVKGVKDLIEKHRAIRDDWAGRSYKTSKKKVDVADRSDAFTTEEGESNRLSTDYINEHRRRNRVESEEREMQGLREALEKALGKQTLEDLETKYLQEKPTPSDNASTDRATEALKSFLDGKGVERAVESLREFAPQAITAQSFDELLKAYVDRLAAWTKDNDEWKRMKSRWGVGRSAETKDEKALQRKVNGGRGALDNIKNMLEFGFPKEFAAFKNLPPAEQARRLGLDVKEADGRVVVTGNTYPLRDMLKDAGFKWDSTASAWTMAAPTAQVTPSDNRMARAKAAADRHVVVYGNGQKGMLADLIKNGGARLYPEKGLTVFDKGKPHVVTIGFQQFTPTKDELPYLIQLQKDYDAAHPDNVPPSQRKEPAKTAHASAPRADGTTTPPKSADAPQGEKSAENATPAAQTPVQKKYAELLAKLDDAGKKLDAAVKAEGASDGAIEDQIARSEALIEQYRAELAVRRFEREHKEERLGQDWKDTKDRPFTSLSDNEIRKRMADSATVIEQLKEDLPAAPNSSAPNPAFKRGDKVFLKGAAENQRVTFLKANADGTADVQVRTPGANRYAPEKVETRTVPMGDISATGIKEVLTEAEKKRLDEGVKKQQTIVMPNAAAAKEVRDAFDAIDFDTPELAAEMPDSFKTMKGTPIRRYRGNVGKAVGSQIYVHKDYAGDVVPADVLDAARRIVAGVDGFTYNTLMWDSKRPNVVRFDEASDFDTAREPHPGRMITVDTESGNVVSDRTNDQIWHHKWLWVKNDYNGFDVNRSKAWSAHWLSRLPEVADGTGHGNARWLAQLAKYGITEPEAVPRQKQGALSGGTSRNQNPSGNEYGKKWKIFRPNTRNADIGAGRFDKATQFLAELGVENIPFDPVNRDSETNRRSAEVVRANPTDTATVHNVLNVIDNDSVLENIVNQAARAIKKSGTAIFTIYEGNRTGRGTATRDGYQRNMKAADYVPYLKKYFGHVETHGNVVLAKQPKDVGSAFWAFDSTFDVGVSFDTKTLGGGTFDPEKFGRLVTGVGNLVDKLTKYGYKDFKSLATYIYEQDAAKYERAKPVLQDIWNAVARARGLVRVSDAQADEVYGIIEAKAKEVDNGNGADGDNGGAGGVRPAAGKRERPGGVLAGGRVRSENPDERVGSVGTGPVPGLGDGLAETEAQGEGASGAGGASEGAVPVADGTGHGERERDAGGDSSGNGSGPAAGVKKPAEKAADSTKVNPIRRDFVMTKAVEDAIIEKRTAERVRNNIAAIKLIRELAKRDYAATPAEQETLAKFVGWGGLREAVFNYDLERAYDAERSGDADLAKNILRRRNISQNLYDLHKELRSILNDKEYDSAKRSSSTAFYTPVGFVRALHDALRNLGVKGGRFLGPSAGTGNFASAAGQYEKPVNWQFVEKDAMTGEILKALFPNQRVTIGGFEETKFPDGFFDFAIDNVPYADVPINDRSLSSKMFKIHDYFFAKTLAKLRPGGVMAFLTSTGTLDKTSPILRQFLTEHGGRIVGAVRLPNGFFSENAGTEAASDLVIVQKVDGRPDNSAFEKGVEYGFTEQWERRKGMVKKPLTYNGYFKDHPEQIVGKMEATSGQYGPRLNYAMLDGDMMDAIRQAVARAFDGIDRDALLKNATVAEQEDHAPIYDESGLRQGNVTLKDGKPFVKSGEMLVPVSMPNDQRLKKELMKRGRTGKGILSDLFALRKAMRDLIDAQMADTDTTETDLAPLQKALGDAYDAFVKKNGTLHDRWVTPFVLLDKADGNRMLALERVVKGEDGKQKVVKSDIFTKRVISRGQRASRAETPKDALVISYSESGWINVPRIAELLGVDEETAIAKLKDGGDAFENPQTGRLEPSWEYLSGRVRAKLAAARAALEAGEEDFRANVEALEKVQPPMVKLEDTEIKFGATWVEPDAMSDFMRDAFGSDRMQVKFVKNEATGQWEIPRASGNVANNESPWGETSWDPLTFVLRVLNHGSMNHIVTDPVTKKKYLDERKTEANKLAAEKMHQAFAEFIMSSDKWAEPMYERYNAVMTDMVEIRLPNNVLPFRSSGMSESAMNKLFEGGDPAKPKKGREYQSAVIARGVLGGSSLCLAHCVGAGKTLEMQSIGMMGRRLGMFKKPMYVVPNHMLEQFVNEFVDAFPNANILKMSEDDVKPENRRAFFAQVANGDWDAIVVKRSTFSKKLAMSTEYQKNYLQSQIDDMAMVIEAMQSDGNGVSVDKANKIREKLQAKLEHLVNAENHDSEIVPFEELGIDQLFIDEAHNFKGLPIVTSQGRTGGLSQGDSQQAIDMQMKTEYVQSLHGGNRGVVFATGTPLSNAPVVESYVILKYLAPNRLKEQGLEHFDDFVGAFGRITTESEFSLDGKTVKERDKVSAFVNIPELMRLFKSVVDIVNPDQLDIPRPKPKYHMIDVDMTPTQARIMEMVADWASMPPDREDRNRYLDLTRIAKNACLTPRLIGFADGGNKVIRAVSEIKRVYDETSGNRGAQLVFTDMFNLSEKTSRNAFDRLNYLGFTDERPAPEMLPQGQDYNLNEEIRDLLVQAGIPKEEIAIIQDIDKSKGDKDANKSALFAKVRSGEVRVLIGSRPKMGEGTNVQERLAAIHLLHPGWKPAEDEQAIGRIIRFGNTYKEGQIFYYLTKGNSKVGSYETKNHQIVGVKGRLIDQVMHGDDTIRVIEMDENAIDRDMLMGLASGNKALMELIDVNKRVHKLELNTESTASSARRLKMKAEATERDLDRRVKEFEKTRKGIDRWNEANKDKPFEITTPDGRTIDKVGEMAQYVSAQVSKQLTKDAYDRDETVKLGEINGIPVVATFDAYDDQKVKIAVPTLGVEREINYSGFIPDFSTGTMTAFKKTILDIVDPSYAEEFDARIEDLRKQTKKMSADAAKLQKDFDAMSNELATLRSRQAQLEREVTPPVVQTVKDKMFAQYGNWFIAKVGSGYGAIREMDGKELRAATVKDLIPLMDAEDFARPGMAATKTRDLTKHLKPDSKGNYPGTLEVPVEKVNFDTPELNGVNFDTQKLSPHRTAAEIDEQDGTDLQGIGALVSNIAQNGKPTSGGQHYYNLSKTSETVKQILRGDYFTVKTGVIFDHFGKDADHTLTADDWTNISEALHDPLVIARYSIPRKDGTRYYPPNSFRVWVEAVVNGHWAMVGVEVKSPARGISVNAVSTVYGDEIVSLNQDDVVYSRRNGEGIQALLNGPNPRQYPESLATPNSISQSGGNGNGVNFDTKNISQAPELTPAEAGYAASEDKTPTEKVMREVYGMTNDEIATALRAAGMEPQPHVRKPDDVKWQQAEALLSNPTYMAKLSRAVAKFPRPLRDYEIDALNVLFRERQNVVNAAQGEVDDWKQTLDSIADGEVGAAEKKEDARKNLAAAQSGLARAKALMLETGKAKIGGASEQGRGLRANRGSLYQDDLTYAGITGEIARIVGGAERVTPEMDAKIRDLAKLFENLDEQGLRIATERLKPLAEKVVKQTKDGLKVRNATERRAGDEAKRVTRNYEDALNQIEVGAAEVGGTLIGLSDQQYPSWGRWLKAIGEFHCFQNPDITEEEVINAILEDISPFMDGVDANQVRDALTGFGHNFKQSRYDSQRLMNDLKSQARLKRQLDWMDENNTMPPLTGMVRDEPSDVTRNLQKQVAERKKEVPDAGRDERRLKGVLDSAKTRVRNRIADLQRAIETGERIPASQRKVVEDLELRELKRQKEELQKAYDELFKTERTMTDAQRIALTEKLLAKELERALEDLDRARAGDFSKRQKRPGVESPTIDVLRDRIAQTREQIRELKKAKYEFGMTPEEIAALNARKMANREKAVARLAERIATGDLRQQKKPQPPMTPDQQKRYDELGEQMKRGRQKLAELRLEAENATVPTFWRGAGNFLRFVTTAQRALRATMDFSAVLRQAARMTLAHPAKAARAFGRAWTAARSEASLQDVNDEIMSDTTVQEAVKKYGLHLREVDATNARDVEMFHGMERNRIKLFGKEFAITDIPFFGEFMLKSERHYLTYLNAMSAEIYSSIVNDARRFPGGATPWQKKMVADMVNIWNGSAALSKERRQALQKAWVNDIFWAPQLAISRVQSAVGYDWWHPLTAKGMKNAEGGFDAVTGAERRAAAKAGLSEHMRSTIAMIAIGALIKWMFSDDDDKYNFSQADWFEKMMMLVSPKIGNTTIDLTGGESTFDKLVHQLATKSKRTGTGRLQKFGEFNGPSTWGAIGRYLQGKLSPSVSTVTALWEGKDYVGDEYGVGKMTQEMLVPLTFEDVKDQIVQNGVGKSLVTVPLTLLGAGGSTYDRKPYENAVNRFLEEKRAYDAISKDAELSQAERKELLDGMKSESPLMTDSVRGDIDARIKAVNRLERKAKDIEKKGGTPTASLTNEIERQKSILLDKIRRSRRK